MQDRTLRELIEEYKETLSSHSEDLPLSIKILIDFFEYHPQPSWIKAVFSNNLRMIRVNSAYRDMIGVEQSAYEGRSDNDIWDQQIADQFEANDRQVIEDAVPVKTQEYIYHPITGQRQCWIGWKWPVIVNNEVVAVCGCATLRSEGPDQ